MKVPSGIFDINGRKSSTGKSLHLLNNFLLINLFFVGLGLFVATCRLFSSCGKLTLLSSCMQASLLLASLVAKNKL